MTFTNGVMARPNETDIEGWGVFFVRGPRLVAGQSHGLRAAADRAADDSQQGALPPPGAGNVNMGAGAAPSAAPAAAPGAAAPAGRGQGRAAAGPGAPGGPAGAAGGPGAAGRGANLPAVELKVYVNPKGGVEEDYPLDVHTRNFLDCVKSRNKKTNAPMEIGYNSALPCLLALESLQTGKVLGWDATARKSRPVLPMNRNPGPPRRPPRNRFHGQGALERLLSGGTLLRPSLPASANAAVRCRRGRAREHGRPMGMGRDRHGLARRHRPQRHRRHRHRAAQPPARAGRDCRGAGREDRPLREAAGLVGRRSARDGRRRAVGAEQGLVQLPAAAGDGVRAAN